MAKSAKLVTSSSILFPFIFALPVESGAWRECPHLPAQRQSGRLADRKDLGALGRLPRASDHHPSPEDPPDVRDVRSGHVPTPSRRPPRLQGDAPVVFFRRSHASTDRRSRSDVILSFVPFHSDEECRESQQKYRTVVAKLQK